MILNKDDLRFYLECDKKSLGINKRRPGLIGDEIWKFQRLLRKVEYYKNTKLNPFKKLRYYFVMYKFHALSIKLSFSIPPNVFGAGLCIAHIGTIVINNNCKVGKNCRIYQNVSLGANTGGPKDVPMLGDDVYIGPGAKLFGNITIADNISIGANAVVNKSFQIPGVTIAGVPAKQISNRNSNDSLMCKTAIK